MDELIGAIFELLILIGTVWAAIDFMTFTG